MVFTFVPCDEYLGITVDEVLHIKQEGELVGICGISKTDDPKELYLEYVMLYPKYSGRHLFRFVLLAVAKHFNAETFILEANEENKPIYEHFGATNTGYDDFREMWEFRLPVCLLLRKEAGLCG